MNASVYLTPLEHIYIILTYLFLPTTSPIFPVFLYSSRAHVIMYIS